MSDIGSDPIRKFRIGEIAIRIRSEIFGYPNFSDRITGFSNRIPGFRIGYVEIFEKSRSVSDPKTRNFFPDTRSEISEILKSDRISEISDRIGGFSDRIFRIRYFCTPLSVGMRIWSYIPYILVVMAIGAGWVDRTVGRSELD